MLSDSFNLSCPSFRWELFPLLFSTFLEQGFRKVDPDRWEFANEGFLRGQKHLLKTISRRKPAHAHGHQQPQQSHGQSSSVTACVEVGKFGLEEEVERLKRDKNVLMQELVRLRQQQQATDNQLQTMLQRLQGMEQRQQQMMSFLAKAVQSPGFLAQFMQQQNDSNRRISEANKKRRLKQEGIVENEPTAPDGQIVKYQPLMNDAKAILRQIMKIDASPQLESFSNSHESFLLRDGSPSNNGMDSGSSSSRISGVTLQEVPPTSGQSNFVTATSGVSGRGPSAAISDIQSSPRAATSEKVTAQFPDMRALVGTQEPPSISVVPEDVIMPELPQIQEMVPENIGDISGQNYTGSETGNGGFLDPTSLVVNGPVPIELDAISPDPDIDALLDNSNFWDDLLVVSPVAEDIESTTVDGKNPGSEGQHMDNGWDKAQHMDNGWDKAQHMDKLTEQMGLLTSDNKGV